MSSNSHEQSIMPQNVVVIGGGTGNSTVLRGLKPVVGDGLSGIVTTFDDGGATGELRSVYGHEDQIGVGDMRQCLDALSNSSNEVAALFNHRFNVGTSLGGVNLDGQTVGNLLITAAAQQNEGNFADAVGVIGRTIGITGRVIPVSHDGRRLVITRPNGEKIIGEHNAEENPIASLKGSHIGYDKSPTKLSEEAEAAIDAADLVVIAPGDLYTSIAPALAVDGMSEALRNKRVIQIANLMNRRRHTRNFTALDYALEIERILGDQKERVIDRVIYNTQDLDPQRLEEQRKLGSRPVRANARGLKRDGFNPVGWDLVSSAIVKIDPNDKIADTRSGIRHDPSRIAAALFSVYLTNGFPNLKK